MIGVVTLDMEALILVVIELLPLISPGLRTYKCKRCSLVILLSDRCIATAEASTASLVYP